MDAKIKGCSRPSSLCEQEQGSDFVVRVGEALWRYPLHSKIVAEKSKYFRHCFKYKVGGTELDPLTILDERAFDSLYKWMYGHEITMSSVTEVVLLLQASLYCACDDLTQQCLAYLQTHVDSDNVLFILNELAHTFHNRPSAPPRSASLQDESPEPSSSNSEEAAFLHKQGNEVNDLLETCWKVVDRDAESVLRSELVDDLPRDQLQMILQRDSLQLKSDLTVLEALERWSCKQCKKCGLPITPSNQREVASTLLWHIRFLRNKGDLEFQRRIQETTLLTEEERRNLLEGSAPPHVAVDLGRPRAVAAGHRQEGCFLSCIQCRRKSSTDDKNSEAKSNPKPKRSSSRVDKFCMATCTVVDFIFG